METEILVTTGVWAAGIVPSARIMFKSAVKDYQSRAHEYVDSLAERNDANGHHILTCPRGIAYARIELAEAEAWAHRAAAREKNEWDDEDFFDSYNDGRRYYDEYENYDCTCVAKPERPSMRYRIPMFWPIAAVAVTANAAVRFAGRTPNYYDPIKIVENDARLGLDTADKN